MIRPESRMNRIKIQLIGRAFFGRPAEETAAEAGRTRSSASDGQESVTCNFEI